MLKSDNKLVEKALLHCPKCNNEFPSQGRERYVHIMNAVRHNQDAVADLFILMSGHEYVDCAIGVLDSMHKTERDAILQPGGILTDAQIKLLT